MIDRIFALCLAAFVVTILVLGQVIDGYDWPVVRMPVAVGGLAVVLLIWIAVAPRRPTPEPEPAAPEPLQTAPAEQLPDVDAEPVRLPAEILKSHLGGILQLFLVVPFIWLLGFAAGLPAYVIAMVRYRGHSWSTALMLAAGIFIVAYVLFWQILTIPIPIRPLFLR